MAVKPSLDLPSTADRRVKSALAEIVRDPQMNEQVKFMAGRSREFEHPLTATLAGVAMNPLALRHFNRALDDMWRANGEKAAGRTRPPEVVVGSGIHAAIYAAARVALGYEPPLVIEGRARAGGSFAVSERPSFYLNSRNRPGPLALPGEGGSLNFLPGSVLQPSHLSNDEFQRNSDLAFVIRATLALNARVMTGFQIANVNYAPRARTRSRLELLAADGRKLFADRVILATGLGQPRMPNLDAYKQVYGGARVDSFDSFMSRVGDTPFPFRGMRRVAVVGGGDGGKTVVEALAGLGPNTHMSVAALDWPERIDWYGLGRQTCEAWESNQRRRYRPLGRLLPGGSPGPGRIIPRDAFGQLGGGFECVRVNGREYDHVIFCTGYESSSPSLVGSVVRAWSPQKGDGLGSDRLGLFDSDRARDEVDSPFYVLGPAAGLPLSDAEVTASPGVYERPENRDAIFRWAPKTAAAARAIPSKPRARRSPSKKARLGRRPSEQTYAMNAFSTSEIPF